MPYYELEVELTEQGGETDLNRIVETLKTVWGLQPETQSKFERALRQRQRSGQDRTAKVTRSGLQKPGSPIHPSQKAPSSGISADEAMSEAGRETLLFHFRRMVANEPGTRQGTDIEALHDMRVATRRMRAAVRVFGEYFEPKAMRPFNKALRRVARALGPVRDLDVFQEKAQHYLSTQPEKIRRGLTPLIEQWEQQRESARQKMLTYLDSEGYARFKGRFAGFLQTPEVGSRPVDYHRPEPYQVKHIVPGLIYSRYETVRAYENIVATAPIQTTEGIEKLHALRIDFKYLRYTLEFFESVLGPEAEAVIKEVKLIQDHLGDLNDAHIALGLLTEFMQERDGTATVDSTPQHRDTDAVIPYYQAREREKHRLLSTFPEAWERFNRPEVRRWLALAISIL
jgi:CHAD domain-containing protein